MRLDFPSTDFDIILTHQKVIHTLSYSCSFHFTIWLSGECIVLWLRDCHLLWIIYKTGLHGYIQVRPQRFKHIQVKTEQRVTLRSHGQGHAEIWSRWDSGTQINVQQTCSQRHVCHYLSWHRDSTGCDNWSSFMRTLPAFPYLTHTSPPNTLGCLTRVGQTDTKALTAGLWFFGHAEYKYHCKGPYTPGRISARVIRQRFSTCFLCSHPSDFRWRWAEWTCKFIPWH